jgi:NitT/TauT family transport system substrate-binding protein
MIRFPKLSGGLMAAVLAVCGMSTSLTAVAADKVTVQLKWLPQAQFAGYYVAQSKGYYKEAGLDVTIKPGGPDISPVQVIAGNGADVVVNWMPDALAAREAGVPLVNIAQVFNQSGLMLTCKKASGVSSPKDFKGKTLGVWYGGNEYPFLNWMAKLGYKQGTDIKILKQGFNVDPLLQNQAACISTMIYNEYWQVVDAGVKEATWSPSSMKRKAWPLEDGLYVMEAKLKDPAFVARMGKFLKATFKGWNDAVKDPAGAAKIVVAADASGSATEAVQKAPDGKRGQADHQCWYRQDRLPGARAYERTVKVLLAVAVPR